MLKKKKKKRAILKNYIKKLYIYLIQVYLNICIYIFINKIIV